MKTNKSIMAVQGLDGELKTVCPICKSEMTWRDLGVSQFIEDGDLVEHDYGGFWECTNTECGYQSEEE